MEKVNKIACILDADFLNHPLCNSLSENVKREIEDAHLKKHALIAGFVREDSVLFVAVFKLGYDHLFIDHVVGNWGRYYKELDTIATWLANACGYKLIAFTTERLASERLAQRANYTPCEVDFKFVKRV